MSTFAESSLEPAEIPAPNPRPPPNPRPSKTRPLPSPRPNPPPRRFQLPPLEPSPEVLPNPSPPSPVHLPPPPPSSVPLPKTTAAPPFVETASDPPLPAKVDETQSAPPPPAHIIPPGPAGGGATFIPLSSLPQFSVPPLFGEGKAGGEAHGGREGPDVEVDQDIFNFRPQLDFEEFIKEHDGTRTNKYIRSMNKYAYTCCKICCYNYLVIIFGIPATLVWAFILGSVSFIANWIYIPILKVVTWFLNITFPVCKPLMECLAAIGPLIQGVAAAASKR